MGAAERGRGRGAAARGGGGGDETGRTKRSDRRGNPTVRGNETATDAGRRNDPGKGGGRSRGGVAEALGGQRWGVGGRRLSRPVPTRSQCGGRGREAAARRPPIGNPERGMGRVCAPGARIGRSPGAVSEGRRWGFAAGGEGRPGGVGSGGSAGAFGGVTRAQFRDRVRFVAPFGSRRPLRSPPAAAARRRPAAQSGGRGGGRGGGRSALARGRAAGPSPPLPPPPAQRPHDIPPPRPRGKRYVRRGRCPLSATSTIHYGNLEIRPRDVGARREASTPRCRPVFGRGARARARGRAGAAGRLEGGERKGGEGEGGRRADGEGEGGGKTGRRTRKEGEWTGRRAREGETKEGSGPGRGLSFGDSLAISLRGSGSRHPSERLVDWGRRWPAHARY